MLLLEVSDFVVCHLNLGLIVHFVREDHNFDIAARVLLDFIKPHRDAQEALTVRQVKHHDNAVGTFVIRIRYGSIPLLTCCIPDLEFDCALVDLKRAEAKVNANRADVVLLEAIILSTETAIQSAHPSTGFLLSS